MINAISNNNIISFLSTDINSSEIIQVTVEIPGELITGIQFDDIMIV